MRRIRGIEIAIRTHVGVIAGDSRSRAISGAYFFIYQYVIYACGDHRSAELVR
jgi:hypothetical protein